MYSFIIAAGVWFFSVSQDNVTVSGVSAVTLELPDGTLTEYTSDEDKELFVELLDNIKSIEKQDLSALHNVADLFDNYFSTFIKDSGEFEKPINIKILGLAAFFHTLPYKNKEIAVPILSLFGIEYDIFIEQINLLERLELLSFERAKNRQPGRH